MNNSRPPLGSQGGEQIYEPNVVSQREGNRARRDVRAGVASPRSTVEPREPVRGNLAEGRENASDQ